MFIKYKSIHKKASDKKSNDKASQLNLIRLDAHAN